MRDLGNGRAWIDESVSIRPAGRGGGKKTSARGGRGQTSLKHRDEQEIVLGLGAAKPVNGEDIDAFVPPKPFASWLLNEATAQWEAPVAMPDDGGMYSWDEDNQAWVEVPNGA